MAVKKGKIILGTLVLLIGGGAFGGYTWLKSGLRPSPLTQKKYIHIEGKTGRRIVLNRLEREGVIRSSDALEIYARWKKTPDMVPDGIYHDTHCV